MDAPRVAEVVIGENTFFIRRFEPFKALKVGGDMQKLLVAPILAEFDGRPSTDKAELLRVVSKGLHRVLAGLDGDTLLRTAQTLLDQEIVSVSSAGHGDRKLTGPVAKQVFTEVADVIELCVHVVIVNFAPLFARIGGLIGQALPPEDPASSEISLPN